ncbi:MAG: nuclear transport factor 2 family protein [Candidatus Aminicenantes bacterium]|nr:nuclear transport factor 2 family protein [Candidatus Aminicenantes bacterium]
MTKRTRRALLFLPFAFVIACGGGKPINPVSFVEKFNALKSRHRIEAALEFLSDDCVLEKPGVLKVEGKAKIREYYEYEKALRSRLVFSGYTFKQGERAGLVSCRVYEQNAFQRAAGLPEYVYTSWEYTLADGRIKRIIGTRSEETARAVAEFNDFFQGWLRVHPEVTKQLIDAEGNAIYSRENADLIVSLVEKYRASLTIIDEGA